MKAVLIDKVTPAQDAVMSEVQIPAVRPGWILVKVMGFGLNHSEQILRLSEINAPYIKKPVVPGIECVGIVEDPSDSGLRKGQKVISLMGGMGRSFNGSYAEYALLPETHVFPVETEMSWAELAAVPETYFTAWGSLFECLDLKPEDTILIRGATCALGYASIQIAKALGCRVIATTHKESKFDLLKEADEVLLDTGDLAETLKTKGITKALELVGPKTVKDTMLGMQRGGIVCSTGILGNVYVLNGFDPIKDIPNGVYLTGFFSNYPTQEVITEIMDFLNVHHLSPCRGAEYSFDNIRQALMDMDGHKVNGKIVVIKEEV